MRRWVGLGVGLGLCACATVARPPRAVEKPAVAAHSAGAEFKTGLVFGTDDPYTLVGFDPQAQWVAMCQARNDTDGDGLTRVGFMHHGGTVGDKMVTYFVLGGGKGEAVDGYWGSDSSGEWVALRKKESIYLLNTRNGARRDLAKVALDQEPDPSPAGGIRNLRFSPKKQQLILVEEAKGGRGTIAVIDLTSGATNRLDLGPGRVWQAGFTDDGGWIVGQLVTRDRNGNGTLDLPTIKTTLDDDPCGQPSSYSTHGLEKGHDEVTSMAIPVGGGRARLASTLQGTLEGDLILTRPDGSLVRENAGGEQRVLAGPACGGAVLDYYSLQEQRWLVACRRAGDQARVAADPDDDVGNRRPTELWVFGRGLPATGQATGESLEYGASPGEFGTARYSRLTTSKGTVLYDLKELKVVPVPPGYDLCTGQEGTYLLEARPGGSMARPEPVAADGPREGVYQWAPGTAPVLIAADADCNRLSEQPYVLVGTNVFDLTQKKLVGTIAPLCEGRECLKLSYAPFAPSQHFLLRHPVTVSVPEALLLEQRLRESLLELGEKRSSERGPLSFRSWSPLAAASAPAKTPKSEDENEVSEWMHEPAPSCEPVVGQITEKPSALPSWTERRPLGGTRADYPGPSGTSDDQPTYQQLQQQVCSAPDLTFLLDGLEPAAVAQSKRSKPSLFNPDNAALDDVEALLRRCAPADTCRHALAIADSDYKQVKTQLAATLLLACDAKAVGSRFAALPHDPLLELEWLVAGQGRRGASAAKMKPLLERIFASKQGYDMEKAVSLVASDDRDDVAALLLETRARLAKAPTPRDPMVPDAPAEKPFGAEDFDLRLGTARHPRLKQVHREACRRLVKPGADTSDGFDTWFVKYSCEPAKPGAAPAKVEYRFLDPPRPTSSIEVTTLARLLEEPARKQCASAAGGKCPDLPAVKLRGGTWHALYEAALELSRAPGSPIAGALLDTPLRRRGGKLEATWRLWLDGRLYEMGPQQQTAASLAWAREQKPPAKSEALAIRGFLAWLNAIASARGSSQRFFFARQSIYGYVVMAQQASVCALNAAKVVTFTQQPKLVDPRDF